MKRFRVNGGKFGVNVKKAGYLWFLSENLEAVQRQVITTPIVPPNIVPTIKQSIIITSVYSMPQNLNCSQFGEKIWASLKTRFE